MFACAVTRLREIIAASMAGSSLDPVSMMPGQHRRVMEGEEDSGTSGSELRRVSTAIAYFKLVCDSLWNAAAHAILRQIIAYFLKLNLEFYKSCSIDIWSKLFKVSLPDKLQHEF